MPPTETSHIVTGAVVTVMREEAGLSGRKLAALCGVSAGHLYRVEAGERPLVPELRMKIAAAIANHINSRRVA